MNLDKEKIAEIRNQVDIWLDSMIESSDYDPDNEVGNWHAVYRGSSEYHYVLGIMTALKEMGQITQQTFNQFRDKLYDLWGKVKRGESYDTEENDMDLLLDEIFSDG